MTNSTVKQPNKLEAQPLYVKVRQALVERMISGQWKPGQAIPSEFSIAEDLGVSQGTVRKALDDMTAQGLVVRRQGRGTFVAEAEDQSILFRFYRLTENNPNDTRTSFPESLYLNSEEALATDQEREIFNLDKTGKVIRFERLRSNSKQIILWERLVLPKTIFPDFSPKTKLPNNVYQFYGAEYGIIIAKVQEKLRAIAAPPFVAQSMDFQNGEPVLEIDRRAVGLDGQIVEWRLSICRSDTMHYRNELI